MSGTGMDGPTYVPSGIGSATAVGDGPALGADDGVTDGSVTTSGAGARDMKPEPRPTATSAAIAAPARSRRFIVVDLHGTHEERRCGIEGAAASTVSSTSLGAR